MDTLTVVIGLGIFFFLMTCWAIMDVAGKDFGSTERKAVWGIIAWIPFIGFVIYFIFGCRKGKKPASAG
ncbi:MAG: hypothetical protein BWK80_51365 [Desulfobacteraceae bacterium IS3]|nr:MAG: hypothetical protein BWK80_51365 [Desulfobacteraceae bacterium IS3]